MNDFVITVENLGKKYRNKHQAKRAGLAGSVPPEILCADVPARHFRAYGCSNFR